MKVFRKLTLVMVLAISGNAAAYDTATHTAMTAAAAGKSRLGISPTSSALVRTIGLRDYNFGLGDKYIDIGPQPLTRIGSGFEDEIILDVFNANKQSGIQIPDAYTISGWLMRGAVREDDNHVELAPICQDEPGGSFVRVYGHFFDPQNNRGAMLGNPSLGPRAPDWALTSGIEIPYKPLFNPRTGTNHYNIPTAREAMWRALTLKARAVDGSFTDDTTPGDWMPPTKEHLRKAYWATTFRALGNVLHVLQDMAQPQHTRGDSHPGLGCLLGGCLGGHDSFIEKYIKARTLKQEGFRLLEGLSSGSPGELKAITINPLDYTSYGNTPVFSTYADFFYTGGAGVGNANGKGLANYSNREFYTAGTNINRCALCGTAEQPSPPPTGVGLGTQVLDDSGASGEYLRDMSGNLLRGKMTFRTGVVRDTAGGADASNVKLSSVGVWDQFLEQKGYLSLYNLNYYNYDDQVKLLIPRAVAYSAGLIDYFFRGQLDITPPDEGVYSLVDHFDFSGEGKTPTDAAAGFKGFKTIKLKLRNTTPDITPSGGGATAPQIMPGGTLVAVLKFHRNLRYTDDLAGDPRGNLAAAVAAYRAGRSTVEEIVVSTSVKDGNGNALTGLIPVTNTAQTYIFEFSQELPINATDVKLQVVYRGMLGSEADAVVVQTVDISEPTYFAYMNATDYIKIGESVYTRAQINAATTDGAVLRSKIRPTQCINTNTNQLIDSPGCMAPTPINFPLYWNTTAPGQIGTIGLDEVGTYHRIAALNPPASTADYYLGASSCLPGDPAIVPSRTVQTNYVPDPAGSGGVIPTVTVDYVPRATRGVNGWYTTSCINNGDGSVPGVGTDDRETKMTPLTGANLKPLQMQQFKFGAP